MKKEQHSYHLLKVIILILVSLLICLICLIVIPRKDRSSSKKEVDVSDVYFNLYSYADKKAKDELGLTDSNFKSDRLITFNYTQNTIKFGLLSSIDSNNVVISFKFSISEEDLYNHFIDNSFKVLDDASAEIKSYYVDSNNSFKVDENYTFLSCYTTKGELSSPINHYFALDSFDNKLCSISDEELINTSVINEYLIDENNQFYNLTNHIYQMHFFCAFIDISIK